MDRGAWWAAVHEVAKELDTTEWLNNSILQAKASWCQERDSWGNFTPCSGKKESGRTPATSVDSCSMCYWGLPRALDQSCHCSETCPQGPKCRALWGWVATVPGPTWGQSCHCSMHLPGSRLWLCPIQLGQPLLLWHPHFPKSWMQIIVKIHLADFPVLAAGPLGPNTWLY